jgi:hypothetical protein
MEIERGDGIGGAFYLVLRRCSGAVADEPTGQAGRVGVFPGGHGPRVPAAGGDAITPTPPLPAPPPPAPPRPPHSPPKYITRPVLALARATPPPAMADTTPHTAPLDAYNII